MTIMPSQIPVTVIGGYLGAGKTTLLNHILRNNRGIRFAVLVNDFGSINIDAALIESQDGDTLNLANGCICCSLAGGFNVAMDSIRARAVLPDRVLVEASGVSDPYKIAQYAHSPGFMLDSIIVLADAEQIQKRSTDKYVGRQVIRQLHNADLLVLNKIDLISDTKRAEVRDWLHKLIPEIRVIEVSQGQLPVEILFGEGTQANTGLSEKCAIDDGYDRHDHVHHHGHDYATWSYSSLTPLDETQFRAWVTGLNENVLRGKGFLYLAEDPSTSYLFQLVGKRWSIVKDKAWGDRQPGSQLVLIGLPDTFDNSKLDNAVKKMAIT